MLVEKFIKYNICSIVDYYGEDHMEAIFKYISNIKTSLKVTMYITIYSWYMDIKISTDNTT